MRRILIDDRVRGIAMSFKNFLENGLGTSYKSPKTHLGELANNHLLKPQQKQYVQLIISEWDNLIVMEPPFEASIQKFEKIISKDKMPKEQFGNDPKSPKFLYKEIVEAMRYDYVQKSVYPKIINQLGIKTCVYCNAQYAFSYDNGRNSFQNYEIDHWMPKSKYPYLCTSFFNLQPSCSKCNKLKSSKDDILPFCLFTDDKSKLDPFDFSILHVSCAQYLATHDRDMLRIIFSSNEPGLKDNMDALFHISTQYQAHKEMVEELLWKEQIYNSTILDIYKDNFKQLGFKQTDFNRFILSNYDKGEDILKRPFAKMVQDIAKQLGII